MRKYFISVNGTAVDMNRLSDYEGLEKVHVMRALISNTPPSPARNVAEAQRTFRSAPIDSTEEWAALKALAILAYAV